MFDGGGKDNARVLLYIWAPQQQEQQQHWLTFIWRVPLNLELLARGPARRHHLVCYDNLLPGVWRNWIARRWILCDVRWRWRWKLEIENCLQQMEWQQKGLKGDCDVIELPAIKHLRLPQIWTAHLPNHPTARLSWNLNPSWGTNSNRPTLTGNSFELSTWPFHVFCSLFARSFLIHAKLSHFGKQEVKLKSFYFVNSTTETEKKWN